MNHQFTLLAMRLLNTPLAMLPGKAELFLASYAEMLGKTASQEKQALSTGAYDRYERKGYDVMSGIAIIRIDGILMQELGTLYGWWGMTGYDGIQANFLAALEDSAVKAIVLLVRSPGGVVDGCFDLSDLIFNSRGDKPIVAVLNEYAYSAGFALASAADVVVVPRTGGTGSVGVVTCHVDYEQWLEKMGMKVTYTYYGDRKIDGAPEFALSDEAKAVQQAQIDVLGELFVDTIARNRGMAVKAVKATQAGTFMGRLGVEAGFADEIKSADEALAGLIEFVN